MQRVSWRFQHAAMMMSFPVAVGQLPVYVSSRKPTIVNCVFATLLVCLQHVHAGTLSRMIFITTDTKGDNMKIGSVKDGLGEPPTAKLKIR